MNEHKVTVTDAATGARLEEKRAELAATLAKPLAPGEIAPAYVAQVLAGPVAVIGLRKVTA